MSTPSASKKSVKRASVIKSIPVGDSPWGAVGVGSEVYVSRSESIAVSVIDTNINEVVGAAINTVRNVRDLLHDPSEGKVYAIGNGNDSMAVIDVASDKKVSFYDTVVGPDSLALSHDGKELYICGDNGISSQVGRYDVENDYKNTVVFDAELALQGIACGNPSQTPGGKRYLYVCSFATDEIRIIEVVDAETLIFTDQVIKVGTHPRAIAINAAGTHAYVANMDSNNISVINLKTYEDIVTIEVGVRPGKVKINPVTGWIYVSNFGAINPRGKGSISILDPSTHKVVQTLELDGTPVGIGFSSDGLYAYVCMWDKDEVQVFELDVQ